MKESLGIALRGFMMGCADLVPGVSGGTVALVSGIYDRLIEAIRSTFRALPMLLRLRFREAVAELHLSFMVPLALGLFFAVASMVNLISSAMKNQPEITRGILLGLMAGSVVVVGRMCESHRLNHWATAIFGAMLAYLVTISTPVETPEGPFYFMGAGMVAICAMILPGISGSFLLLVMGKYMQVIEAIKDVLSSVKDLLQGNLEQAVAVLWEQGVMVLGPFAIGCALGLSAFSSVLSYLLKEHRNMVMCLLLGLMIGSLHKLWPFREVVTYLHREGKPDKVLQDQSVLPFLDDPQHLTALAMVAIFFLFVIWVEARLVKKQAS